MDDDTRAYLKAMEARLMARLNNNREQLLERLRLGETAVAGLVEVVRGTNTTLASITALLTTIATSHARQGRAMTAHC